jgi:hypothetical protein
MKEALVGKIYAEISCQDYPALLPDGGYCHSSGG